MIDSFPENLQGGKRMINEDEAVNMLTNFRRSACKTCLLKHCNEACKLLEAVDVGIEAIRYKQAVYNLGKARTKT